MSTSTLLPPSEYLLATSDRGVLYRVVYESSFNLIYKLKSKDLCNESFTSLEELEERQVVILRELNPKFSIEVVKKINGGKGSYEGLLRANGEGTPISLKGVKWKVRSRFLNRCVTRVSMYEVWNYPLFPQLTYLLPLEEYEVDVVYDSDQGVAHE